MAKILISACLLGCKVRYNGNDLAVDNNNFQSLLTNHTIVSFCPEVSAGMSIPRAAAEIVGGDGYDVLSGNATVVDFAGHDVTHDFVIAAKNTLTKCIKEKIMYAVLAESSPSCGSSQIYDGNFNHVTHTGKGVTAALLEQNGIRVFNQQQANNLITLL